MYVVGIFATGALVYGAAFAEAFVTLATFFAGAFAVLAM
jgi:hypothetical protein